MCRLFAQLSTSPESASEFLSESTCSLLKQSDFDPQNPQKDGWGIGSFTLSGKARVVKSPRPANREIRRFIHTAKVSSQAVIGHLRAASNPRGIPIKRLISMANSQPYTDGRWIFAHNGTLQIPDEVAGELGSLRRKIRSQNDSEVYFWQFMKFLEKTGNPARSFESCARENWRLWLKCRTNHPKKNAPYTSLNAIASNGKSVHVFCHAIAKVKTRGICNPEQPWYRMSYALRKEKIIIGSEDMDGGRWRRLGPSEVLSAAIGSGKITLTRQRVRFNLK
ncbi:MAG: class II glutamine amidotransferase [Elusimicrobiota bacterium]